MILAKRIEALVQYSGLSIPKFADYVGFKTPQTVRELIKGNTKTLSDSVRFKIASAYPQINPDWLLSGEGEMLKPKSESMEVHEEHADQIAIEELREGRFRMIPLVNIDSVGGIHSENSIDPSEQYVIKMMPFTEARDGDVAILQSGNSMYPTIPSGAALLIREVVDWREYFGCGNIYVLWLRDGRRITKEVRRYDADPKNYVWCVSYNPDVADEELPRSMIRGVWKVIKYIADFGW